MANWASTVEADATVRRDDNIAAGAGNHLPIGYWSGAIYRSLIRFPKPPWASWTAITKATLSFYISDHQHVGVRNSSIYVRRCSTTLWTKAAGTQNCESGYSAGNNTQDGDFTVTTAGQVTFSSGSTANAKKSVDVTALTRVYFDADSAKVVFVLDPVSSSDYTELWSDEKGATYDAVLSIDYEVTPPPPVSTPPLAPTLDSPVGGATVDSQTPTFAWTHNPTEGEPQTGAEVQLYDAAGTTLLGTFPVSGSGNSVVSSLLTRGTTYQWTARTADVAGWGPFQTTKQSFVIRANPVVTVSATRKMIWNGAPRLLVEWTVDQPQASYQVTAPGYDSGVIPGGATSHTLDALALTNGTPVTVTVAVTSTYGLPASAAQAFTPRWGLTTHHTDLGAGTLVGYETPVVASTVPTGATLRLEYGSSPSSATVPDSWQPSLSNVAVQRHLFWRAWFIPSASAGPTIDAITIRVNKAVQSLDKWTRWGIGTFGAPWSIDTGEYVYGTRSVTIKPTGTWDGLRSGKIRVRNGRSYILTGLMKSVGNPQASFYLVDVAGVLMASPTGQGIQSPVMTATTDWWTPGKTDANRYKTPVWVAPADMDVYILIAAMGATGQAWFDAIKLEESTVATPWTPGAVGATVIDAGGVQIDATAGGLFRYRGTQGGVRDIVEGAANGLRFGGDTEVLSPAGGTLRVEPPLATDARLELPGYNEGGELSLQAPGGATAWQIDNLNGQMRVHGAGVGRAFFSTASPHLLVAGDARIEGNLTGGPALYGLRAQMAVNGGGQVDWTAAGRFKWATRFIAISIGLEATAALSGYFDIDMPPVSTVIPGVAGHGNVTVEATGIPLSSWDALWYILPLGQGSASQAGNFRVGIYNAAFSYPSNWVLLALHNFDASTNLWVVNGMRLRQGQTHYVGEPVPRASINTGLHVGAGQLVQAGTVSVVLTAVNSATAAVTFPRAFSAIPIVTATSFIQSAGGYIATVDVTGTTTSAAVIRVTNRDTGNISVTVPVNWIAVGSY